LPNIQLHESSNNSTPEHPSTGNLANHQNRICNSKFVTPVPNTPLGCTTGGSLNTTNSRSSATSTNDKQNKLQKLPQFSGKAAD